MSRLSKEPAGLQPQRSVRATEAIREIGMRARAGIGISHDGDRWTLSISMIDETAEAVERTALMDARHGMMDKNRQPAMFTRMTETLWRSCSRDTAAERRTK
jgi:hypothetical protein